MGRRPGSDEQQRPPATPPGPGPITRQLGRGHLVAVVVLVVLAIVLSVVGDGTSAGHAGASL